MIETKIETKAKMEIEVPIRCSFGMLMFAGMAAKAQIDKKNELKNKRKMNTMKTMIVALLILSGIAVQGQESEKNEEYKNVPFQLTFVSPVGTNGVKTNQAINKVSINLLAGYARGLDGFEFSGMAGILLGDMKGTQLAGYTNVVLGNSKGTQISGFCNYNKGTFKGAQLGGFANVTNDNTKGAQLSGFANVTIGSVSGAQVSGFSNVATKDASAIQVSGFANYSKGNTIGQVTGFANVNAGDLSGVQIAGFANANTGEVDGVQLAGFANYTRKLKGIQLGVFNYVDSIEKGTPIGVFSFVRNGYRAYEISSSETLYGISSFKTGTRRFYNILSIGASYKNDMLLWGWGYGIGTNFKLTEKMDMDIELISYHINEDEWFTDRLNMLNKLQITENFKLGKLGLFGGLSWNIVVSDTIEDGQVVKSNISPWSVFNETYDNDINVKMYPGLVLGIRF